MKVSTRLSFVITALLLPLISTAAAEAQEARCRPCEIALERCSVNCFGREDKRDMRACLIGCDNAASICSCDEPATLGAEDYAVRFGLDVPAGLKAAACHSTTPCDPSYGACTNWSSYTDCGDPFCGIALGCGQCNEWGQCLAGGPATKQYHERYRVCLNEVGQSCTEYQRTTTNEGCGC